MCVGVKKKHKQNNYRGLRVFIGALLTGLVLFAYYYPDLCPKKISDTIYCISKEHLNLEGAEKLFAGFQEKAND